MTRKVKDDMVPKGLPSMFGNHKAAVGIHLAIMTNHVTDMILLHRKVSDDTATGYEHDAYIAEIVLLTISLIFFVWALVGTLAEQGIDGMADPCCHCCPIYTADRDPKDGIIKCNHICFSIPISHSMSLAILYTLSCTLVILDNVIIWLTK